MKILMISPEPFFEPRGTPISVYQRLHALSALGHEVDLLTYPIGQDVKIPGVIIHRTMGLPFVHKVKVGPSWTKLWLDIILVLTAIRMLTKKRYDVIHSHEEAAFFSMFLAKIFHVRHLYDMHSSLPRQLGNFNYGNNGTLVKLFEILEYRAIMTCDALITIGSDLEKHAKQINPAVNQNIIQNLALHSFSTSVDKADTADLKKKLSLENKLPIVYTGTFERYQGLDLLLNSAAVVVRNYPEAVFVMVGGEPHQVEQWANEAKRLQLESNVLFVGTVRPREALIYLDLAEILVSPRIEGTSVPLKIYSYLHAGKAMVATNLVSHTQVLTDEIAMIVEPTANAFAQGLIKLIQSPELRQQMAEKAKSFGEAEFNATDYLDKIESIYQTLKPATGTASDTKSSRAVIKRTLPNSLHLDS